MPEAESAAGADDPDAAAAAGETEQPSQQQPQEDEGAEDASWRQAQAASSALASHAVLGDLEQQYVSVKKERDDAVKELQDKKEELAQAQHAVREGQERELKAADEQHKLKTLEQNVLALQEEKKAAEERADRMLAEVDRLREEISNLTKSNSELSKSLANYEVQSKLKESQAIPLHNEKLRLQTELDSLQAHANWVQQEFEAKSRDYTKLQQEARDHKVQLQLQLDQTLNDKEAAVARLSALQNIEHALQDKVKLLSHDLLGLKQEIATLKETTQVEILEERKVINLQKNHLTRWEQRYNDAVVESEALKKTAAKAMEESEKERQEMRHELEHKYKSLLEEQAAEYEEKLRHLPAPAKPHHVALPASTTTAGRGSGARDDDEEDEGPMSLTELYTRLEETKEKLRKDRLNAEHWKLAFDKLSRDVQASVPRITQQRQEYELATEQNHDYRKRLNTALEERNHAREDTREASLDAANWKRQYGEKAKEVQVLANQVQVLLVSRAGGQVAGDDIPTSVSEMQSQNQRLLVEHRKLKDKVSELEGKLHSNALRAKLDAAESELCELHEERKKQEIIAANIVQQRDLYRALLNKHDSNLLGSGDEELTALELSKRQSERATKLEQKNRALEGELAAARSEAATSARCKEEMSERLSRYEVHSSELNDSVNRLERELLTARSEVARTKAESEYHKDSCLRAEQALERSQNEVKQVSRVKNELQIAISNMQQALSNANSEASRKQSETQQALMKLRLAETQAQTARSAESRLAEENGQLLAQIARQGSSIDAIRRIEESLAAKTEGATEELKREIERLTKELNERKSRDSSEAETWKGQIRHLEATIKDLEGGKSKAELDSLTAKKNLLEAKTEAQALTSKCSLLESQLRSAKNKLGETGVDVEDAEAALQSKIESLTSELESARSENNALVERATNYQKISKDSETSLLELRSATDAYKAAQTKDADNLKSRIESMTIESQSQQEIIKELTDDLASQRNKQQEKESELQKQIESLKAGMQTMEKDSESAKASVAALKLDMDNLRAELERSQNNYERELALHAEARTSLRAAREQADEVGRQRTQAVEKLEGLKTEIEQQRAAWVEEKIALQESSNILEKWVKDTRESNKVLHAQIDSLGEIVEKSQKSRVASATDSTAEEVGDLQRLVSELREGAKFLRSENEMIQTQLANAVRSADRERASASVLRRNLDEARAELQTLQSHEDGTQTDTARQMNELKERVKNFEDQVKLLNDSNKLLRDEADNLQKLHGVTLKDLEVMKKSVEPAEALQRELGVKIASLKAEKASLTRELEDWKNRVKSLVSKFNQIDPEEHRQLKIEVEELKKERESLIAWKRTTEEENTRIRTIAKNLKQKMTDHAAIMANQQKEIEKLVAASRKSATESASATECDELKQKVAQMEKEAASKNAELAGSTTQNERLRGMLRTFQTNIKDLRSKEQQLAQEIESLKANNSDLEAKVKGLQQVGRPGEAKEPTPAEPPKADEPQKPEAKSIAKAAPVDEKSKQNNVPSKPVKTNETSPTEPKAPTVPEGGFKFGPSETGFSQATVVITALKAESDEKPSEATEAVTAKAAEPVSTRAAAAKPLSPLSPAAPASMRATAKPFLPSTAAAAAAAPAPEPFKRETSLQGTDEKPQPAARQMSSEKIELVSMKEKLLEKKRKLAEALKRKAKAAKAPTKAETEDITAKTSEPLKEDGTEAGPEQPTSKRAKLGKDDSQSPATLEQPAEGSNTEAVEDPQSVTEPKATQVPKPASEPSAEQPSSEAALLPGTEEVSGTSDDKPEDTMEHEEDTENAADAAADDAMDAAVVDAKEEAMEEDSTEKKASGTPFGTPANLFGATTSGDKPAWGGTMTFGQQAPTAPSFFGGKAMTPGTTSTGAAFLNIKPPSSSTTPPSFTFGNSGSITLPTPSQPSPSSLPFGGFGGGSTLSFGIFGATSGGASSMTALPLFGAPPAAVPAETGDAEAVDEVKMDDDEGDMEAED